MHIVWDGPTVEAFWERVSQKLSTMVQLLLDCSSHVTLCNDDLALTLNLVQRQLFLLGIIVASSNSLLIHRQHKPLIEYVSMHTARVNCAGQHDSPLR